MINYSINRFFNEAECNNILKFLDETGTIFSYNPTETWDCKRIYDNNFKEYIHNMFKQMWDENRLSLWFNFNEFNVRDIGISLTKYYDGRFLELHRDKTSQLTTVIVLTEDFDGGRFALTKTPVPTKFKNLEGLQLSNIKIGEGITFDGTQIFHGVLPVTRGIRCAMNIWMANTNSDYASFNSLKSTKTLI